MRILFFHPLIPERDDRLSYDTLMNKSGFSGTETALIEISKYLTEHHHKVTICGPSNHSYQDHQIDIIPFHELHDVSDYDVYCPLMYQYTYESHMIIERLPKRALIWIWFHCFVNSGDIIDLRNKGFQVIGSFPSAFVGNKYNTLLFRSSAVIGNAIHTIFLDTPKATPFQRKGQWFFHATFERGGNITRQVFERVQQQIPEAAQKLTYASYFTPDSHSCPKTHHIDWLGSVSKVKIATMLASTDYFVYPLVLPNSVVHHDTYASVILEALVSGAIVVTWNVACIPEVYGDIVVGVDPCNCNNQYDLYAASAHNSWMLSEEAVEKLANKIIYLERHPEEKECIRQRGMEWAKQFTWEYRGNQYESWLSSQLS